MRLCPQCQTGCDDAHKFCPTCGIHSFGEGTDASGKAMAAINARCLEDIDLATIDVTHFDGRSR